jgi:hypothetical protein
MGLELASPAELFNTLKVLEIAGLEAVAHPRVERIPVYNPPTYARVGGE